MINRLGKGLIAGSILSSLITIPLVAPPAQAGSKGFLKVPKIIRQGAETYGPQGVQYYCQNNDCSLRDSNSLESFSSTTDSDSPRLILKTPAISEEQKRREEE